MPVLIITARETTTVKIAAAGPQGPQGIAGQSGGTIEPIAFAFGDASGVIYTPTVAGTVTVVRLVITTAFDGVGAALALGTTADHDCIMAADENEPTAEFEFEITADKHLALGEGVRIDITPGGSPTQGAGLVYITFAPD